MDLKKVRLIAVGAVAVVAGAGLYMWTRPDAEPDEETAEASAENRELTELEKKRQERIARLLTMQRAQREQREKQPRKTFPLRDFDRGLLQYLEREQTSTVGDAFPKEPAKVEVVVRTDRTSGRSTIHHVNIDLNRDGRVDEQWTLSGDEIRRHSRSVHEYRGWEDHFVLQDDVWALDRGDGRTAAQEPVDRSKVPPVALRPVDRNVLELAKNAKALPGRKVMDATPGQPHQVMVEKRPGGYSFAKVRIDLDRDKKWDERWVFEKGKVMRREVSPQDDGQYTEIYSLDDDKWIRL